MVNQNDILAALQGGADPEAIAQNFADALNAAIAEKAKQNLEKDLPGIRIVGTYAPPFGFEKDEVELKKINEMLGVEITGNRIIPGLTMALALKRLDRAVS